jgi:hypothetical protein
MDLRSNSYEYPALLVCQRSLLHVIQLMQIRLANTISLHHLMLTHVRTQLQSGDYLDSTVKSVTCDATNASVTNMT